MSKRRQRGEKSPLYRKVNTRTHGVHHGSGLRAADERGTKPGAQKSMRSGQRHGLDYTPLFRFLLSRVGTPWDSVYAEAVSRLDKPEPIFWLVAEHPEDRRDVVRTGESSYYNGLFVDGGGLLAIVDPTITIERITPQCPCCTHSFNGKTVPRKFTEHGLPLVTPN
ncbi:hypothetical protein [uncultured Pelagimonas sp.]|uniref:hypothetical protein n=1 Tax=uncultured Pelagimonas sp. TaxID=1618102 RepID=UPI002613FEA5|nr:hypothetical protein [uncultured Pelagimonas sp.]